MKPTPTFATDATLLSLQYVVAACIDGCQHGQSAMRVPLDEAAAICGVKPGTLRRWVMDGRIIRHSDSGDGCVYDVDQLLQWIEARNPNALMIRAGITGVATRPERSHLRSA